MKRRNLLASPSPTPQKPVFLEYSQEQLDKAYDQSFWAPQMAELEADDGAKSTEVRRRMPPRTERYGGGDANLIDIFAPPNARGAPVLVFLHGGAWTRNSRQDASFPAPALVGRGAAYLAPDFGSLKTIRLPEMIENCRLALEWTVRNAQSFGGDPSRVFLAGHSSGGHLAGCVLITDWAQRGLPADCIKGALLMSGMYDLYPVRLSSRSAFLHITPEEEMAASPMRHLNRIACPVAVTSADEDSPEFKRQSAVLADALQGMGRLASRTVAPNANHFQEDDRLGQSDSEISRALFALMGI
ncbi:MAG: alpha/beta hydrolase [Alphaproteobacteria bacterium]